MHILCPDSQEGPAFIVNHRESGSLLCVSFLPAHSAYFELFLLYWPQVWSHYYSQLTDGEVESPGRVVISLKLLFIAGGPRARAERSCLPLLSSLPFLWEAAGGSAAHP